LEITRTIPRLSLSILRPLLGERKPTKKNYLNTLQAFERECEQRLIKVLRQLEISASVKSNPYKLPYKKELVYTLGYESWLNEPYRTNRIFRPIIKEMLSKDVYYLRFYMLINVKEFNPNTLGVFFPQNEYSYVEYRFRYFERR
jgi:hypothetical protein